MKRLTRRAGEVLERYRLRLASSQADGFLALLGLLSGIAAALAIVAFRYLVQGIQQGWMADLPGEAFEWLQPALRFALPAGGGLAIGIAYWLLPASARTVGVVHVLERLHYHQGYMPWRNLVVQFLGGALALASGQSVGREGPSVHLGSAVASLLGRRLMLPNNSVRTLVACGAAAAIAASFNTPLAGVVFSLEVILVEYTIAGFVPVILAAVAATAISRAVFGDETAFLVPLTGLGSQWELPWIMLMGALIGAVSAAFVRSVRTLDDLAEPLPVVVRLGLAGCVVGAIAVPVPQVLGLGYDTVDQVLGGRMALPAMLAVLLGKFAATAACSAVRMPGGLIGPTIVMGSLLGGCFAALGGWLPAVSSSAALYAMLGMGALMGAVLQAPLAALLALLEFTGNPLIIMPAMLAVVTASQTARLVFGQESVFTLMMRDAGLDYRHDPVSQGLRRVGITAVMNRSFESAERRLAPDAARALLKRGPQWIVLEHDVPRPQLLPAADLARFLEAAPDPGGHIDLLAMPASRYELKPVHLQATLFEAREIMDAEGVDALYVRRPLAPMSYRTFGIVLRADVESGYAFGG